MVKDEDGPDGRPIAYKYIADVGKEEVHFLPEVPLSGKVEIYMQTVLDAMKSTLFKNLQKCLVRYAEMDRPSWLMHKDSKTNEPADPAQISLLTLAVNYVAEVEQAFAEMERGDNDKALEEQNEKQIGQLSDLIRLLSLIHI